MGIPTLSIITVNLNDNKGLQKTIEHIQLQKFEHYEHIIIDAGSTDGSKDTIIEYSKVSSHLTHWISEPDKGVYDGMNKGIAHAKGEYLLFLNAGDFLEPNILETVSNLITNEDIIYGNLNLVLENGNKELLTFPAPPFTAIQVITPSFYLPHPATFIRRTLFANDGYSVHYKIVSDWEFWIKCILLKDCSLKHIPFTISNFVNGGLSTNPNNYPLVEKEKKDALQHLFNPKLFDALQLLATLENSPLYEVTRMTLLDKHFQKRMSKLLLFCYKLRSFFKRH